MINTEMNHFIDTTLHFCAKQTNKQKNRRGLHKHWFKSYLGSFWRNNTIRLP